MSKSLRIAVTGAGGRMSRAVIAAALDDPRFIVAAAHSRRGEERGEDAATLLGRPARGVAIASDLAQCIAAADVVIDFTRPEASLETARLCAAAGRALVCGTTGLSADEFAALALAARQVPVFHAPNMSVGVNLLIFALREVAARLGEEYDAEIVESHHRHKVDAPSGTALALGSAIAEARGRNLSDVAIHGRSGNSGPRAVGVIGFHALRGGEIVGEHDVRLISANEEIRLGHTAFRREAFATGALRAAAWLVGRAPGLYGMRELLELDGAYRVDTARPVQ